MGFIPVKISFVISKVELDNALVGISVDLKTHMGEDITVLKLNNLGTSTLLGGLQIADYSSWIVVRGHPCDSNNGILFSLDKGKTFIGSFIMEVNPDDYPNDKVG